MNDQQAFDLTIGCIILAASLLIAIITPQMGLFFSTGSILWVVVAIHDRTVEPASPPESKPQ